MKLIKKKQLHFLKGNIFSFSFNYLGSLETALTDKKGGGGNDSVGAFTNSSINRVCLVYGDTKVKPISRDGHVIYGRLHGTTNSWSMSYHYHDGNNEITVLPIEREVSLPRLVPKYISSIPAQVVNLESNNAYYIDSTKFNGIFRFPDEAKKGDRIIVRPDDGGWKESIRIEHEDKEFLLIDTQKSLGFYRVQGTDKDELLYCVFNGKRWEVRRGSTSSQTIAAFSRQLGPNEVFASEWLNNYFEGELENELSTEAVGSAFVNHHMESNKHYLVDSSDLPNNASFKMPRDPANGDKVILSPLSSWSKSLKLYSAGPHKFKEGDNEVESSMIGVDNEAEIAQYTFDGVFWHKKVIFELPKQQLKLTAYAGETLHVKNMDSYGMRQVIRAADETDGFAINGPHIRVKKKTVRDLSSSTVNDLTGLINTESIMVFEVNGLDYLDHMEVKSEGTVGPKDGSPLPFDIDAMDEFTIVYKSVV